jgi:hypothetical protein
MTTKGPVSLNANGSFLFLPIAYFFPTDHMTSDTKSLNDNRFDLKIVSLGNTSIDCTLGQSYSNSPQNDNFMLPVSECVKIGPIGWVGSFKKRF